MSENLPPTPENRVQETYSLSEYKIGSGVPVNNRLSSSSDVLEENADANVLKSPTLNGSRRNSKGPKEKKVKNERLENTTMVVGTIDTTEKFTEFLELAASLCGPVRSHYFRAYQFCGFVYFHDEETATKAKATFDGYEYYGQTLKACAPSNYFENEEDARPKPPDSARRTSKDTNPPPSPCIMPEQPEQQQKQNTEIPQSPAPQVTSPHMIAPPSPHILASVSPHMVAPASPLPAPPPSPILAAPASPNPGAPACTLVLKNLHFNLKQEKLLEMLSQLGVTPQSVNYHYDQNGNFCGIAFAKYRRVEEATKALESLANFEIGKRKVRVEFKRRKSIQTTPSASPVARGSVAGHEMFDSMNMDAEQSQLLGDLMRFLENPNLNELSFPPTLTVNQRSNVHIFAEHLGLCHMTNEVNDSRYVVVSKTPAKDESPRRTRHMSFDSNSMVAGSPLQLPRAAVLPPRIGIGLGRSSKEHITQPKGPDGSKGFAFGRGRRIPGSPALTSVPTFNQGMASPQQYASVSSVLGCGVSPRSAGIRSASFPMAMMQEGAEFTL